jgi:plasmid stabilization system protein ParE
LPQVGRYAVGRPALDEESGVRLVTHARYNIYYRINMDHVRILRILHGARQVGEDDI